MYYNLISSTKWHHSEQQLHGNTLINIIIPRIPDQGHRSRRHFGIPVSSGGFVASSPELCLNSCFVTSRQTTARSSLLSEPAPRAPVRVFTASSCGWRGRRKLEDRRAAWRASKHGRRAANPNENGAGDSGGWWETTSPCGAHPFEV